MENKSEGENMVISTPQGGAEGAPLGSRRSN